MDNEAFVKLTRDMRAASATMTRDQARYLCEAYLDMQGKRKGTDQQIGAMEKRKEDEPHKVLDWISENVFALERQILSALQSYAESQPMGRWALEVCGIGPVIAAGLLAHIDIEKCPTVGHIWAFAGLDPSKKWEKGQKRPHNAALKVLCFYAGESFIKVKGNKEDVYGKLYETRKVYEQGMNERGEYAEQAKARLAITPKHAQAKIYKSGKLPPGHIHARCRRYAVKQFLADWHAEAYRQHFGKEPPLPYPIAILGHAHMRAA
jgi:hypothetical protein